MVRTKRNNLSCKRKSVADVTSETEYHDRVLVVGDKKFYVVSRILKMWSPYFRKLFSDKPAEENAEIKLEDVDPDVFEEFLYIIYGSSPGCWIDNMSALIELSVRFETPKVIETCKELMNKYEKLKLGVDVFRTACKHNLEELKELIIEYLMSHPSVVDLKILKCAVEYKLDSSLVETLGATISTDTYPEDCAEILDFAFSHNIPTMKEALMKNMSQWKEEAYKNENHYYGDADEENPPVIEEYDILPLLECAFKYDIEILKSLLRHRIYYCVETTDHQFNEFIDANVVRHPLTINTFVEENMDEIFSLPKELMEFGTNSDRSTQQRYKTEHKRHFGTGFAINFLQSIVYLLRHHQELLEQTERWFTTILSVFQTQAARPGSAELPTLPGGIHHKLENNYYHTRDGRHEVLPPQPLYAANAAGVTFGTASGATIQKGEAVQVNIGPDSNFGLNAATPGFGATWKRSRETELDTHKNEKEFEYLECFDKFAKSN